MLFIGEEEIKKQLSPYALVLLLLPYHSGDLDLNEALVHFLIEGGRDD